MKISEAAKKAATKILIELSDRDPEQYDPEVWVALLDQYAAPVQFAIDSETKRFSDQLIETTAEVLTCREAMKSDDAVICDLECENATLKRKNAALDSETRELREALKEQRRELEYSIVVKRFDSGHGMSDHVTVNRTYLIGLIDAALSKAGAE